MSFPYLSETKDLNETTRKEANGSFIRLSEGVTHYELAGPESGEPVVLVHGFSVPYYIYDPTFEFLVRSGFRTLRYDLFGRGWSDRPNTNYDINFFVKQLKDLLDALGMDQVNLVGLSMGGPITATFTEHFPEQVKKLVLIDPLVHAIGLSRLLKIGTLPGIGELVLGLFGNEGLIKSMASDFFDPALVDEFQARYRVQMQFKGFKRAILSSVRNNMLGGFYDVYERIGKFSKPTLIVWGREDSTVPFVQSGDLLRAIPRAQFLPVDACGHIPHYEKPEIVNPKLLEFLQKG